MTDARVGSNAPVVVNVLMNGARALPERSVMSLVATTVIVASGGRVVATSNIRLSSERVRLGDNRVGPA